MNPQLVVIAGPFKGVLFPLIEAEIVVGREPEHPICLGDLSVSRRHCLLSRQGEQVQVRDLDSRNGTFVNGVPVKERWLTHNDQLKIGDHLFLFLVPDETPVTNGTQVQFEDSSQTLPTTLLLPASEAFYQQPEKLLKTGDERALRELNALLKISTAANSLRQIETLAQRVLELSFEILPAEQGAVLLCEAPDMVINQVFSRQPNGPTQAFSASRTVTQQVLRERVAVLCSNLPTHESLTDVQSLHLAGVQALLAVPLLVFERVTGLLYFVTHNPLQLFDEGHLRLLTAIAGIAARAFENLQQMEWLSGENQRLQAELTLQHNLIGESPAIQQVLKFIAKVAPSDATVLIRGESGTGKELAARAIHQNSARAGKPFIAINCAALSETLLESELFGHEKGAFTGATVQKKGKLEMAHGGTVFLDELGEMSLALQAKLLRALQEKEFERVGGTRLIKTDLRVIAATNRDLESAIKNGTFRADLYYRLNVVTLTMPALRARRTDIPLLAHYFAAKYGERCNRTIQGLSPATRHALQQYDWPGNVRELENALERAVVLGTTAVILPEDLPETVLERAAPENGEATYLATLRETKRRLVTEALEQAQGNYVEAARLLGMHVNNLHRLLKNLNLKPGAKC